jgi:ubiquinone/menaquinone biosynthesis C-methylase UbiE
LSANTFSPMLRGIAGKVLPFGLRQTMKRWLAQYLNIELSIPTSYGFEILRGDVQPELLRGWKDPLVAERQDYAFAPLLRQMRDGYPREDFVALAEAVRMTDAEDPLIVEVGCGSAWNSEVLAHLLNRPFRYVGVDYSQDMLSLAKRHYPQWPFVVGDATALPFRDKACDILLSGTVLMHLLGYQAAIQESRRVARCWCVFHTVPVLECRETTFLRKEAYGQPTIEVILNEREFKDRLKQNQLVVREVIDSLPYNLEAVLGESTVTKTYVCEIIG